MAKSRKHQRGPRKPRDIGMFYHITHMPNAGAHQDRKKEASKRACRKPVKW